MERQQEYELRKKIADAIQNDVNRVFFEKLQLLNHDFYGEIIFPLTVLEMTYKKKSDESAIIRSILRRRERLTLYIFLLIKEYNIMIIWQIDMQFQSLCLLIYLKIIHPIIN